MGEAKASPFLLVQEIAMDIVANIDAHNQRHVSKKLIAVDFDGTIATHAFPELGEALPEAFEVMQELQAAGHKLILNTCRENEPKREFLSEAVRYCRRNGVEFRSINENHREDEFRANLGRKVFAHFYIDDRNIGGFPGWAEVRNFFKKEGLL